MEMGPPVYLYGAHNIKVCFRFLPRSSLAPFSSPPSLSTRPKSPPSPSTASSTTATPCPTYRCNVCAKKEGGKEGSLEARVL